MYMPSELFWFCPEFKTVKIPKHIAAISDTKHMSLIED